MEQVFHTTTRMHPLLGVAAVSVITLSATGIAALTGLLPVHHSEPAAVYMPAPARLDSAALPGDAPATNTVVIQNNAAPATVPAQARDTQTQDSEAAPIKRLPRASRPRPLQTSAGEGQPAVQPGVAAAPLPTASASAQLTHPTAVSSSAYEAPPAAPVVAPVVAQAAAPQPCANCGVIESIREVKQAGNASGVGAVAGGVGGAVVGKQFGKGRGSDLLTVLGAVGGAIAGHQVEKNVRSTVSYEVNVRMEDGSVRSFPQATAPAWRPGEHVRVDGSALSVI